MFDQHANNLKAELVSMEEQILHNKSTFSLMMEKIQECQSQIHSTRRRRDQIKVDLDAKTELIIFLSKEIDKKQESLEQMNRFSDNSEAIRNLLDKIKSDIKVSENQLSVTMQEIKFVEHELQDQLGKVSQATQQQQRVLERRKQLQEQLSQIQAQELFDKDDNLVLLKVQLTDKDGERQQTIDRIREIDKEIDVLGYELAMYDSSELGVACGEDISTLFSLFELKQKAKEFLIALNVIASHALTNLVCMSSHSVGSLLEYSRRHADRSFVIWPLDRIDCSQQKNNIARFKKLFKDDSNVVLPLDLLDFEEKYSSALIRCFGNWVITNNDETSIRLLQTHRIPSM